jgi:chorismate dehydratase
MSSADDIPKLRMAQPEPPEPPDLLEQRVAREKLVAAREVEVELDRSLAPFRVGSVAALNAVPLTRGLEDEVLYAAPSKLAELLRRDELDAALVSVAEVLLTGRYDVLDGIAIASLGEVKSVLLAHRLPLEKIREVHLDPASITSANLVKVLLAERGLQPAFKPLPAYEAAPGLDAVLLIGDRALDFSFGGHPHSIWDLGAAWFEMTQLPFVYAVWALRRGLDNLPLRRALREARDFGLDTLEHIINTRREYTREFRKDYLGWHIHYHLGTDEKRGLVKFMELLEKHGLGPVHKPSYVN